MKIVVSCFLAAIIFFNTTSLSFADANDNTNISPEKIILPKIPIYISGNSEYLYSNILTQVYDFEETFYELNIIHKETKYKKINPSMPAGSVIWAFVGLCNGFLADELFRDGHYDDDYEYHEEPFRPTWTISLTILGGVIPYLVKLKKSESYPTIDCYLLQLFDNKKIIKTKIVKVPYEKFVDSKIISKFLDNFDRRIKFWNKLDHIVMNYNTEFDYSNLDTWKKLQLSFIGKPKGEYETTMQYEDRLRQEDARREEIETEYKQKLKLSRENREIEKIKTLREIKDEIKNIQFNKNCDFMITDYNADRQLFTFIVPSQKWSNSLFVPIGEAKEFKSNIGEIAIQQKVKPTLDGKWELVSDNYVLINTSTDQIIPWESGQIVHIEKLQDVPPSLMASINLIDPSGDGYLNAGEIVKLQVSLMNDGKGSAKNTRISLSQKDGTTLYYDVSKTIDKISSGDTKETSFNITVPDNINTGKVAFNISFLEEHGFEPPPISFTAETQALLPPNLELVNFGVNDQDGNGKVSKGEPFSITARIQNKGQGKAKNVNIRVVDNPGKNIFLAPYSEKTFYLGNLNPGESRDVNFSIITNNRVEEAISINIKIEEERTRFLKSDEIELELEKELRQLKPLAFKGKTMEKEIPEIADLSIDVESNIPITSKFKKQSLAIIFGIEKYRNVSNASFANRDATFVKEYFVKTLGIPTNSIYFKTNEDVTLSEFNKVFAENGWLNKRVKKDITNVYIYFAGHGAPSIKKEAYLIPSGGDINYPAQTGYSLDKMLKELGNLNAKSVTVLLDACFSGINRDNEILLAGARPISIKVKKPYLSENVTFFSATSGSEISSAYPEKKHGLFTYFLLKGLQGSADINNDNELTVQELFDFLKINVSETAGMLDREQTPELQCINPERVIVNY